MSEPLRLPALALVRPAACEAEEEDEWLAVRARRDESPSNLTFASSAPRANRGSGTFRSGAGISSFGSGFDDFPSNNTRKPSRASGRHTRCPPRPTQRQPIDDQTSVPPELYEKMMKLGSEARKRATHKLTFDPDGIRYLQHADSDAMAKTPSETETISTMAPSPEFAPASPPFVPSSPDLAPSSRGSSAASLPELPSRPASSCAAEVSNLPGAALDTMENSAFCLGVY